MNKRSIKEEIESCEELQKSVSELLDKSDIHVGLKAYVCLNLAAIIALSCAPSFDEGEDFLNKELKRLIKGIRGEMEKEKESEDE